MRSSTRRSSARAHKCATDIRRSDNVVDLAQHRAPRTAAADRNSSLHVAIDADGFLHCESHIRCEDADRFVDVLLLMLLKAREARAGLE